MRRKRTGNSRQNGSTLRHNEALHLTTRFASQVNGSGSSGRVVMRPRATRWFSLGAKRGHVRLLATLMAFGAFSAGCLAPASQSAPAPVAPCPIPPADVAHWELVEHRAFAFRLPPGFRHVPVQGIDSYVGRYEADGVPRRLGAISATSPTACRGRFI